MTDMETVVQSPNRSACFTGHRALPDTGSPEYRELVRNARLALDSLTDAGITDFYAGGAAGFDMLAEELVLQKKERDDSIRLHVLLPYEGFGSGFAGEEKQRQKRILSLADEVVALCPRYFKGCFLLRDRELVARSDLCIAYLRKTPSGTAYTVSFARQKGIEVIHL